MPLQSPFHNNHLQHGAQMIDVFGRSLVWSYGSVEEEVRMVRERAGITDFSFNTLTAVVGKGAFSLLQKLCVNDLNRIGPGRVIYTPMVSEAGTFVYDATVFWMDEEYFIVNIDWGEAMKHPGWIGEYTEGFDAHLVDTNLAFMALQGPKSRDILGQLSDVEDLSYYSVKETSVGDIPAVVARLGFTGELGYEIYVNPVFANDLWGVISDAGREYGAGPYGLSATMVMGIEKGFLWGGDFYAGSTPFEVGTGWTVRLDKDNFMGKEALVKRKENGLKTRLVAFEVSDPEIFPTPGDELFKDRKKVGSVTNANLGLTIGRSVGRGWIDVEYAREGEALEIKQYEKRIKVNVSLQKDWYDPENKKVRS